MAETKPTKVARWATDANRTLEPAAGEKNTGWQVDDRPPARFMNWLHNIAYQWFNWLDERMVDGATSDDFTIRAPSDGGGDLLLKGGSKTGTDQDGGEIKLFSGVSSGDGGSEILFGIVEENQGAGAVVRNVTQVGKVSKTSRKLEMDKGVKGTGGTNQPGVEGVGGSASGTGVKGTGAAGNAVGVEGQGHDAGTGAVGTGGTTSGIGTQGIGGTPNGMAFNAIGKGTGAAMHFNFYLEGEEMADPAAPAANLGRIYFRDNGGKTELVVVFPTGAVQQIAIEP